ncbi:uncharacterized protein PHACADRAFT_249699 [Phanerochaete carnosa HHB-10118-sp]|uniref:Pentatricopeptide repeat-containing protein-mitochondrial domain-containing protein n=1 Tax=Phanerochaete carnosa (strain HHB-10118-sp) TaxID=650164 RepID=K5WIX2_PHACS|nr:uncharacterized protein PHACADRAFT_249699 [Phanerochaete carnosa HHB-10118-sp]EKM59300.1 hypothetical protein PHACADRAFT_249699 [Phanerochaete carnosa HHB-10118-sp]
MYRTLVAALRQFRDPRAVFEFVLHDWEAIGTYLNARSVIVSHPETKRPTVYGVDELRRLIYATVDELPSAVDVLVESERTWPQSWRQRAGEFLIDVLIFKRKAHEALAVLREVYRQGLHVPGYYQLEIIQSLAKANSFEIANPMYATLLQALKDHHGKLGYKITETGLYLFARQGDIRRTQRYFRAFRDAGGNPARGAALLLHAHAAKGDATGAVAVFNQYCSDTASSEQVKANIVHYTSVIHAHARRGDHEGMNLWLQKLAAAGYTPDKHVYNVILKAFADKGEIISMGSVLDQMRATGIRPDRVAYTTAITALAEKKDPIAAEALFRQASQDGVVPDRVMLTALMNAHVEAGSWQGAINVFDYLLTQTRRRKINLSIEIYNTLLKAYVLIGAPFSTVFRLFHRLEQMHIRPDDHTFALVMQSACDGNVMDVAEKLYTSVKAMSKSWENGIPLTVYLATIMMGGYLKHGHRKEARQMYQEMIKLGIQPSSVTFANILTAYTNERSEESIQIAKKFLDDLLSVDPHNYDWMQNARGAGSGLEEVYGPLLRIYAKIERADEVETLLQDLFDKGGEPSLANMTALLDVYRRTDNSEGAREVWPQIYKLALEVSNLGYLFHDKEALQSDDPTRPGARRQAIVLAIPLSIYIDALSTAGLHMEVARVWQELKNAGFTFDSHNWNHLCVALVRAGEVERAFEVIERVILPFRRALMQLGVQERDQDPQSPLLTDWEPTADDLSRPPTLWPMRDARRRNNMQKLVRKQHVAVNTVNERPQDFAHALHVLRQVSPQWNQWRPHVATLQALADAYEHLHSGNLVQPVQPAGSAERAPQTIEDVEERASRAQGVLDRIYDNHPNALDYVTRFIEWRKSHGHTMKKRGYMRR